MEEDYSAQLQTLTRKCRFQFEDAGEEKSRTGEFEHLETAEERADDGNEERIATAPHLYSDRHGSVARSGHDATTRSAGKQTMSSQAESEVQGGPTRKTWTFSLEPVLHEAIAGPIIAL